MDLPDRYWGWVRQREGCWEWTGSLSKGHGKFMLAGRRQPAHRWAYEFLIGDIPQGLDLDHLCRNRACVNPTHCEPVTRGENVRRGQVGIANSSKTRCIRGHEFTPENTYYHNGTGWRNCRACMRLKASQNPRPKYDRREYRRRYRVRNLERLRAYDREWRRKNRAT